MSERLLRAWLHMEEAVHLSSHDLQQRCIEFHRVRDHRKSQEVPALLGSYLIDTLINSGKSVLVSAAGKLK
jgi:hypothetical protein